MAKAVSSCTPRRLHEVGDVGEDVVGALRLPRHESRLLDVAEEQIAARLIRLAQAHVVRVRESERGDRGLLQRMRRADRDEVVGAADADAQLSGATAQPTRQPVTEYDFEMPEMVIVRSAMPGSVAIGVWPRPS